MKKTKKIIQDVNKYKFHKMQTSHKILQLAQPQKTIERYQLHVSEKSFIMRYLLIISLKIL